MKNSEYAAGSDPIHRDRNQKTIKKEVVLEGVGLHTGETVAVKIKPAGENTGIRFQFQEKNIPAQIRYAGCGMHYSFVKKEDSSVRTVEHLLSALMGMGVSNAVLEVSGGEIPFFDGSSLAFSRAIAGAGFKTQNKAQKRFSIKKPVVLQNGRKLLAAFPSSALKIFYLLEHSHPRIGIQSFSPGRITPAVYLRDIAPARTFATRGEARQLIKAGLAKGGTMASAVLAAKKLSTTLRFPNEFARHKCLDLIGDLALLGMPLHAHIVALRTGHAENHAFVKKLLAKNML